MIELLVILFLGSLWAAILLVQLRKDDRRRKRTKKWGD